MPRKGRSQEYKRLKKNTFNFLTIMMKNVVRHVHEDYCKLGAMVYPRRRLRQTLASRVPSFRTLVCSIVLNMILILRWRIGNLYISYLSQFKFSSCSGL